MKRTRMGMFGNFRAEFNTRRKSRIRFFNFQYMGRDLQVLKEKLNEMIRPMMEKLSEA